MATAAELRAKADAARDALRSAQEEADRLSAEALRAEYEEAQAIERTRQATHCDRMYAEIGQPLGLNEAQHGIVYSLAWEKGRGSGYVKVTGYYEEFAVVARAVLATN